MSDTEFLASLLVGGTIGFALGIITTLILIIVEK